MIFIRSDALFWYHAYLFRILSLSIGLPIDSMALLRLYSFGAIGGGQPGGTLCGGVPSVAPFPAVSATFGGTGVLALVHSLLALIFANSPS